MQVAQRRVRKLTVRCHHESTLTAYLNALQDAFNIASLPGAPPNGLLLVRRLDLGVMRPPASDQGLSHLIDSKIHPLCMRSVCVDEVDAANHDVVWFSDLAKAICRLLYRVAHRYPVDAWYWPVLLPGYKTAMGLGDVLDLVGNKLVDQASGMQVMAAVIQQLGTQGLSEKIIGAVTPSLAQQMLVASHIYPCLATSMSPPQDPAAFEPVRLSRLWQQLLTQSIKRWGRQDTRTRWMAVNALITSNPALLTTGAYLAQHVQDLINHCVLKLDIDENAGVPDTHDSTHARVELGRDSSDQIATASGVLTEPDPANMDHGLSALPHSDMGADVNHRGDAIDRPQPGDRVEKSLANDYCNATAESKVEPDALKPDALQHTSAVTRDDVATEQTDGMVDSPPYTGLQLSDQAGFVFLIAALAHLRINECLALNPQLAVVNLPVRVIRKLASRCNVANHHPLLRSLPEQLDIGPKAVRQFTCPSSWIPLSSLNSERPVVLHRYFIRGSERQCCLTDRCKKMVLYVGDSKLNAFPDWMTQCRIEDHPGWYKRPGLVDIEVTIQLLLRRYLARYARIGLRALVQRPGKIALTRTHLDVVFTFEQIDIHIRSAGLDIDPGWVSWLGKVVQFHYESGERVDA